MGWWVAAAAVVVLVLVVDGAVGFPSLVVGEALRLLEFGVM